MANLNESAVGRQSESIAFAENHAVLLDALPTPVVLLAGTRLIHVNKACRALLGIAGDRPCTALSIFDFIGREYLDIARNSLDLRECGRLDLPPAQYLFRRCDGSTFHAELSASSVPAGSETALLLTIRDLTEQLGYEQALRRNQERYRAVVDGVNEGIIIADSDGKIVFANQQLAGLCGYSGSELVGHPVGEFIRSEIPNKSFFIIRDISHASPISPRRFVEQIRKKDGSFFWGEISAAPLYDGDGTITGTISAISDVTQRVEAEEALRDSRRKYRELVYNAPIGIALYNIGETRYEYTNKEFLRQCGYTIQELNRLLSGDWLSIVHPEDRTHYTNFLRAWREESFAGTKRILYRALNKTGAIVWLDTHFYADFDSSGRPIALNEISVDVTEFKAAESALASALQEDFSHIIRNLQNLVFRLYMREDGEWAFSLREGKLAGDLTTEKVKGLTPLELFGENYIAQSFHNILRAARGEHVQYETYFNGKWQLIALVPLAKNGRIVEIIGSGIDITSRKETENRLQESEERYRTVIDYLPVGILHYEQDGAHHVVSEFINPAALQQIGYSPEELAAMSDNEKYELIHPEDREMYASDLRRWRQNHSSGVLHLNYRYKVKSGEYRWFDNYAIKIPSDRGHLVTIQAVLDVTNQKRIEEQLRAASSRMETLIRNINIGVMVTDKSGTIVLANEELCSLFRIPENSGLVGSAAAQAGRSVMHLFTEPEAFIRRVDEILSAKKAVYSDELFLADGRIFERDCIPIVVDAEFDGFIWQYRDITKRKQAERELRQALEKEREVSMLRSRFVSTVSHEFRTPLTGIMMSAELLECYHEHMSEVDRKAQIDKIKIRVDELVTLLNDFLLQSSATSLRDRYAPSSLSLEQLSSQVIAQHDHYMRSRGQQLVYSAGGDIPNIRGDRKLLQHVLDNLLSNASKYSPEGAEIRLSIERTGGFVQIVVEDRGIGIPDDELENLFIPYFRASNVGKTPGTGLGLSIVKEFVEIHDGTISVESSAGKGSKFTVKLPALSFEASNRKN